MSSPLILTFMGILIGVMSPSSCPWVVFTEKLYWGHLRFLVLVVLASRWWLLELFSLVLLLRWSLVVAPKPSTKILGSNLLSGAPSWPIIGEIWWPLKPCVESFWPEPKLQSPCTTFCLSTDDLTFGVLSNPKLQCLLRDTIREFWCSLCSTVLLRFFVSSRSGFFYLMS
jgi:hypothetical protein